MYSSCTVLFNETKGFIDYFRKLTVLSALIRNSYFSKYSCCTICKLFTFEVLINWNTSTQLKCSLLLDGYSCFATDHTTIKILIPNTVVQFCLLNANMKDLYCNSKIRNLYRPDTNCFHSSQYWSGLSCCHTKPRMYNPLSTVILIVG